MIDPPALRFSAVSCSFGRTGVLEAIDAEFPRRSRTMIAGENGAGKTTLLKIALGLITPDSGIVEVMGHRIGTAAWRRTRRRTAYVHQGSVHVDFPISAREVVSIGTVGSTADRRAHSSAIDAAMEATGCRRLADRPYRVLSGGEKQRVSIARCLCQDPEVLLLDEPCASLDPEVTEGLMSLLERLSERITVVMVTHDVQHLDRPGWTVRRLASGVFS